MKPKNCLPFFFIAVLFFVCLSSIAFARVQPFVHPGLSHSEYTAKYNWNEDVSLRQPLGAQHTVILSNPLRIARPDEPIAWTLVALEKVLGTIGPKKYVVLNDAAGRPIPVQYDDLDGDGLWDELFFVHGFAAGETFRVKLLVSDAPAAIRPVVRAHVRMRAKGSDETFGGQLDSVAMPIPSPPKDFKKHRLPQWLTEGPSWENDKVAYRFYFDTRNGKDIYGKRIPAMVMDFVGVNPDSNYHQLDYWGMDILKVGGSLGAGALALSLPRPGQKDTLIRLGGDQVRKETYKQIADGPLRAIFRMDYEWDIGSTPVTISEEITITAGQYYYTSKVKVRGAPAGAQLVTGIANFYSNEPGHFATGSARMLYSYGMQSENKDLLGMAILVGKKDFSSFGSQPASGTAVTSTYTVAQRIHDGQPLFFRFYTCWEKTDPGFGSAAYFDGLLRQEAARFNEPIRTIGF